MVVRQAFNLVSRNDAVKRIATNAPLTRDVVRRFVAGERTSDAVRVAGELAGAGLRCTLSYLSEDVTDVAQVSAVVDQYRRLIAALEDADLTDRAELSIKLGAIGQALPDSDADQITLQNATAICEAADKVGMTATVDMEEHETVEATLSTVRQLRQRFDWLGVALQADLMRTEDDCRALSYAGSRVRLCKGAYRATEGCHQTKQDIDLAFVRCLKILMAGGGFPMIATHDPRMIEITSAVAVRHDRERSSYELQMLYGVRPDEQKRLASLGERVRVYVPYGADWYPWLVRRMAERPANLMLLLKSIGVPG
ncbi:MAG: proline dehydrogenase family protein [Candidatus Nanopelagicales bacterium]|nr:proline dehydrogenase family protein [Candidatus Nanopelagicales bacterium]